MIAPYLYAPGITGEAAINLNSVTLSKKHTFGGMLGFEAYNPKWAFYTDLMIVDFKTDITAPLTGRNGDFEATATLWGIYGMRRLAKWIELGLGGRLNILNMKLKLEGSLLFSETTEETTLWLVPPLVVYRLTALKNDKWNLGVYGDVGGFGFFDTFTYLVSPHVNYRLSNLFEIYGGWRLLSVDHNDESGGDKFDVLFNGPQIGLLFHL